jgi:hypothetical protein
LVIDRLSIKICLERYKLVMKEDLNLFLDVSRGAEMKLDLVDNKIEISRHNKVSDITAMVAEGSLALKNNVAQNSDAMDTHFNRMDLGECRHQRGSLLEDLNFNLSQLEDCHARLAFISGELSEILRK